MIEIVFNNIYNIYKEMESTWSIFWDVIGEKLLSNGFSTAQFVLFAVVFIFWKYSFSPLSKLIKEMKTNVDELHNAGREMQNHLGKGKRGKLDPVHKLDRLTWAVSNSPFQLNLMGENLYTKSGMSAIVEDKKEHLIGKMKEGNPLTGYDVEKCAFHAIEEFVSNNKETEENIKNFIFKNPVFEGKEVGLGDIFFVGSIKLRDIYFDKYPETNTDDEKKDEPIKVL